MGWKKVVAIGAVAFGAYIVYKRMRASGDSGGGSTDTGTSASLPPGHRMINIPLRPRRTVIVLPQPTSGFAQLYNPYGVYGAPSYNPAYYNNPAGTPYSTYSQQFGQQYYGNPNIGPGVMSPDPSQIQNYSGQSYNGYPSLYGSQQAQSCIASGGVPIDNRYPYSGPSPDATGAYRNYGGCTRMANR